MTYPFTHEDCPNCLNRETRETTGMICQLCGHDYSRPSDAGLLGYRFVLGPEVPRPVPWDWTMPRQDVHAGRAAWVKAITEAVQYHDAWGLLRTRPDGDVTLYDVVTLGSFWASTGQGGTIHLLLAREV